MVDVAKVSMFGIPVGIFNWDADYGVARFEYDQSLIGFPVKFVMERIGITR